MKKFFFLMTFLILMFAIELNAQVKLGFQAGANFADVSFSEKPYNVEETSIKTGILIGGILVYDFSPVFSLQFQPAYVMKGAKANLSTLQFSSSGFYTIKSENTFSADYLDFPVLLKASIGNSSVKPYVTGGITVSFLLGDAKIETDKATINGVDVTSMMSSSDRERTTKTTATDFILNFGAGVEIPIETTSLFIEGQYNVGIADVNDDPDSKPTKTVGIQAKAGLLFPLK